MKSNAKEVEILYLLMKSPKTADKKIAEKVDLSRSGVAKHRKKMEREGGLLYFASPNLSKEAGHLTQGTFRLSSSVTFKEASEAAHRFCEHTGMLSVWMKKVRDRWNICFLHYNIGLETKLDFDRFHEKLTQEVRAWFGTDVSIELSSPVYFFKMLGQNFESKWW